jgi:ParB family chromosome partitioning protein
MSPLYDAARPQTTARDAKVESVKGFEGEPELEHLAGDSGKEPLRIALDKIRPSTHRLRHIDEAVVDGLVLSIKNCGLLQPIMVTRRRDEFEVVFGNHRLEACRRLSWKDIPATIVEVSEKESLLLQIAENIQRNMRINPVEEAKAFKFLLNEGMTIEQIAKAVGKSYQYVWSKTRLLETLHPKILERLEQDRFRNLKISHAEQLSLLRNTGRQLELAGAIEDYGISLKKLEEIVYRDLLEDTASGTLSRKKKAVLPIWKTNETFFVEKTRHCLMSYTTFNAIVDGLGKRARIVGRNAGGLRRQTYLQIADRTISRREWVLRCFNGPPDWGRVAIDGSTVTFSNAIVRNTAFAMGYVEGLLGIRLKRVLKSTGVYHSFEAYSPRGEAATLEA